VKGSARGFGGLGILAEELDGRLEAVKGSYE
jgi:hypothetical protein